MKIRADERVRALVRVRDVARQLRSGKRGAAAIREHERYRTWRLRFRLGEVDRVAMHARRRAGLEPDSRKSEPAQRRAEPVLGASPTRPPGFALSPANILPPMNVPAAMTTFDARTTVPLCKTTPWIPSGPTKRSATKSSTSASRGCADGGLHLACIRGFVCLRTQRANRRALAFIEPARMDVRRVDADAHLAAERIDFACELALRRSADRRIAWHQPDGAAIAGHHQRVDTDPSRSEGCFQPSVSAADDDDAEIFH